MTDDDNPNEYVYLVMDCEVTPGRLLSLFRYRYEAERFSENLPTESVVLKRTVFYEQPPTQGFNL